MGKYGVWCNWSDLFRLGALTLCVLLIVGCTEVVKSTPNEIHIDTGELGQLVPGSRHWLALNFG